MEGESQTQTEEVVQPRKSVWPWWAGVTVLLVAVAGLGIWLRSFNRIIKQNQAEIPVSPTPAVTVSMPVFIDKVDVQTLTSFNQLPHTYPVRKQEQYKDWVFLASDDQFFQFDATTKKIIRFTDSTNLMCGFDFIVHRDFLYLVCNKNDYSDQRIYEVDLATFTVKRTFARENGILSESNYELLGDGDTLWVGTFNGLGHINLTTGNVKFYKDTELGLEGTHNGINWLKQDERAVWIYVSANAYTNGGLVEWDKQTKQLAGYGPSQLKMSGRIDLAANRGYGFRFVPGGVEVAIRGADRGYTRVAYSYDTKEWSVVGEFKDIYADKEFDKIFPPFKQESIFTPEWDMYPVAVSRVSNEKVYLLDNAGIGVVDQGQEWPRLYLPVKKDLQIYNPSLDWQTAVFYVRPGDERGFAYLTLFCADGNCAEPELVFFDLQKPDWLSRVTIDTSKHPAGYQKLTTQVGATGLVDLLTEDKKVFATVNLDKQQFTFAK